MRSLFCVLAGLILLYASASVAPAATAGREGLLMDFGWRFNLGDAPDAGEKFDYPEFASFSYDLSKLVKPGGKNSIVVRVDASRFEGWWYEGAGIYRHVWLVKATPVHVAHWGTYVTSSVNGNDAEINIQTTLRNDGDNA